MKIFAVVRNYGPTEAECLFGAGEPTWYEMADSSILKSRNPFFVPDFACNFIAFPTLALRIGRLGKSIAPRFAQRYIESGSMAVAVVAADLLARRRENGEPWAEAVSFDRSCLLGNLQPIDTLLKYNKFTVNCGETETGYEPALLKKSPEELVSLLSRTHTLKNGDLILAGLTPAGITLTPGTRLKVRAENDETNLLEINIK